MEIYDCLVAYSDLCTVELKMKMLIAEEKMTFKSGPALHYIGDRS